jgi:hypothetical protein
VTAEGEGAVALMTLDPQVSPAFSRAAGFIAYEYSVVTVLEAANGADSAQVTTCPLADTFVIGVQKMPF